MRAEPSLSIGEVSRRTNLSERALRLYEAEGLVAPSRTAAGRRVYAMADLRRLQQVQLLRRAGYALAEIRSILRQRAFDATEMLSLHLTALRTERKTLDHAIKMLEKAQVGLDAGVPQDAEALCELIRLAERSIEEENWRIALSPYWTPEEQERWKTALNEVFTEEQCETYQRDWRVLVGRVEDLIGKGVSPESDEAIEVGRDWLTLQEPYMRAVPEYWPRLARMYAEMDKWSHLVTPPFSKATLDYAKAAVAAGRAKGVIPPSKYKLDEHGLPETENE